MRKTRKDLSPSKQKAYDLVVKFLKSKRLYTEFMRESSANKNPNFEPLIKTIQNYTPNVHLACAFSWKTSKRGLDFWREIDKEWMRYYAKN